MFLLLFAFVLFFWPEAGGLFLEHDNFVPANPLVTPEHIKPVWYFTPYYAILKAVPDKLMGVILMGLSVVVLFFLPWLDRSPVKSIRYKGLWYKIHGGPVCHCFRAPWHARHGRGYPGPDH